MDNDARYLLLGSDNSQPKDKPRKIKILQQRNKYHVIFCNSANVFHTPLPFYGTLIIKLFQSLMMHTNPDKAEIFPPILKSFYLLLCLYFKISFPGNQYLKLGIRLRILDSWNKLNFNFLFQFEMYQNQFFHSLFSKEKS